MTSLRCALLGVFVLATLASACSAGGEPPCGSGGFCRELPPDAALDARGMDAADGALDGMIIPADVQPVEVVERDAVAEGGGMCANDDACNNDQHCVSGRCVAWGRGESDPLCNRALARGPVRPGLQCVWSGPADTDPHAEERAVLHTPLVANFGFRTDVDAPSRPSIAFVSDNSYRESLPTRRCGAAGTVRLIDGATCREQAAALAPGDRANSSVTPAIGDLDGDGRPDLVTAAADGGLIAYRVDPAAGTITRLWKSTLSNGMPDTFGATMCLWGGVSIADLDDDGSPEVLFEGSVWSARGVLLASIPGWTQVIWGAPMIAADVDGDGRVEVVDSQGTWEWRGAMGFVRETYDTRRTGTAAHTALADFGEFPGRAGDAPGRPELVSVVNGRVQVFTIGGDMVFDMAAPTGSASGGPPTIADYDGDGRPEIGVAFSNHYAVFDVNDARLLWSRASQDRSSARTSSSVFDFNADGRAEVVYGDECFVRVYDGRSGDVLFSQARFSSTWHESAIVADVDADGSAEVVIPTSGPCRPMYCPDVDDLFPGLRCETDRDCPGGRCNSGLCRCNGDLDCGATYACLPPAMGTPGTGSVCRAVHRECASGLRVYRDARDRWAPARGIWNQHAYHITNVNDDGTIPRSSMARANWSTTGLNNFRQNQQGPADRTPTSDLTVGALTAECDGMATRLRASVCNRGRTFLDAGLVLVFRRASNSVELCRLSTRDPIGPGACTPVECTAMVQARGVFEATADPDESLAECKEGNNTARGEAFCGPG